MKSGFNKIINNILKNKTGSVVAKSPLSKYFTLGIVGISAFLIIIVVIITIIFAPIMMAQQYVEDVKNDISLFFEKLGNAITLNGWCSDTDGSCQRNAEQKYYEQLDDTYRKYKEDGVEIDTQLITGTIFYGSTLSDDKFQDEDIDTSNDSELVDATDVHLGDVKTLAKNMVSGRSIDYAKYRKYLVDTYIPKRFDDMYTEADKEKAIQNIADEIMSFASGKDGSKQLASNCSFNEQEKVQVEVDKKYIENIQINTLFPYYHNYYTENATEKDIEYTVSLKEYVTGVVYREIHAGINPMSEETIKANLVAIKSYTLGRRTAIEKNGKYYINMRNNTDDQVYCNLDKGCQHYSSYGEINLLNPAPSDVKELLYRLYDETFDEYVYNTSNNKFIGAYTDTKGTCVSIGAPTNCMSQTDSITMGNNGNDYKAILASFYNDNAGLLNLSQSTVSTGAYACSQTTYMGGGKYSSNAPRYDNSRDFFSNINYNYFLPQSYTYYGECTWYAKGRAIEIMANSNIPDELRNKRIDFLRGMLGNGADWYNNPSNELFSKSTDLYAAKPGSIISWMGGNVQCYESPMGLCGHVGIIEDVEYDSNGKAKRVLLSEGWNGTGNAANASYAYRWLDMESLRRYSTRSTYYFNGYVYLLD